MLLTEPSYVAPIVGLPPRRPSQPQARIPSPPPPPPPPKPSARAVFEMVIEQHQAGGMSRGGAIRKAIAQYPDLHQAWLVEINA